MHEEHAQCIHKGCWIGCHKPHHAGGGEIDIEVCDLVVHERIREVETQHGGRGILDGKLRGVELRTGNDIVWREKVEDRVRTIGFFV